MGERVSPYPLVADVMRLCDSGFSHWLILSCPLTVLVHPSSLAPTFLGVSARYSRRFEDFGCLAGVSCFCCLTRNTPLPSLPSPPSLPSIVLAVRLPPRSVALSVTPRCAWRNDVVGCRPSPSQSTKRICSPAITPPCGGATSTRGPCAGGSRAAIRSPSSPTARVRRASRRTTSRTRRSTWTRRGGGGCSRPGYQARSPRCERPASKRRSLDPWLLGLLGPAAGGWLGCPTTEDVGIGRFHGLNCRLQYYTGLGSLITLQRFILGLVCKSSKIHSGAMSSTVASIIPSQARPTDQSPARSWFCTLVCIALDRDRYCAGGP